MNLRMLATVLAVSVASVSGVGCTVSNPNAYNPCKSDRDCSGIDADLCVGVIQNWGGGDIVENGMCSTTCATDLGCSRSHNGTSGYCSTTAILGVPNPGVCFERCYTDYDCATGYTCANSKEVYNLPPGVQICVPQPNGTYTPPPQYPYSTCASDSNCLGSGTDYCVTFDPKWINSTAVYALDVCSSGCTFDTDCAMSANGDTGYCTDSDVISPGRVCMERCEATGDCAAGMICTQMREMVGFPNSTEGVCAPDPNY